MREAFHAEQDFRVRQWTTQGRPIIASFVAYGWQFEILGAAEPVAEQAGWRHFEVERRLLDLGGETFRADLLARRQAGAKTEPAFAAVLGLADNPYDAMLALADQSNVALAELLTRVGFAPVT